MHPFFLGDNKEDAGCVGGPSDLILPAKGRNMQCFFDSGGGIVPCQIGKKAAQN